MKNKKGKMGKYIGSNILTTWEESSHSFKALSTVHRASKNYMISDMNPTLHYFDEEGRAYYHIDKSRSARFKFTSEGELKAQKNRKGYLGNGVSKFVNSLEDLKCAYSFEDLFETPMVELYHPESVNIEYRKEVMADGGVKFTDQTKVGITKMQPIPISFNSIVSHLKNYFQVDDVYKVTSFLLDEHEHRSILENSQTVWHLNLTPDVVSHSFRKDRLFYATIYFWYFGDKVAFRLVSS